MYQAYLRSIDTSCCSSFVALDIGKDQQTDKERCSVCGHSPVRRIPHVAVVSAAVQHPILEDAGRNGGGRQGARLAHRRVIVIYFHCIIERWQYLRYHRVEAGCIWDRRAVFCVPVLRVGSKDLELVRRVLLEVVAP